MVSYWLLAQVRFQVSEHMDHLGDNVVDGRKNPNLGLLGALIIIVLISLILVAAAYIMYLKSPQKKYDLARPGNSLRNKVLSAEDNSSDKTTPIDAQITKAKIEALSTQLKVMAGFDSFSQYEVNDQSLGLQPVAQ